jgi:uncharacterized membrane protein required for colicin V production
MFDLLAAGFLGLFGYLGWRRGTVLTALAAGGLVVGYLGALLLYRPVGLLFASVIGVPPILAFPLGGLVALLTISILMKVATARVAANRRWRLAKGWIPSRADRGGGAALGVVWALGLVILLAWAGIVLRGLTGLGPDAENTISGRLASAAVGNAVYAVARRATGSRVLASTMALVAVKPSEGAESLNRLVSDGRLRAAFQATALRDAFVQSDAATIAQHPAIRSLAGDAPFLEAAEAVRLVGDVDGTASPEELSLQLTEHLGPMVRTMRTLSDDPEIQTLLEDEEFMAQIDQVDLGALATDPRFNLLAGRILSTLRAER